LKTFWGSRWGSDENTVGKAAGSSSLTHRKPAFEGKHCPFCEIAQRRTANGSEAGRDPAERGSRAAANRRYTREAGNGDQAEHEPVFDHRCTIFRRQESPNGSLKLRHSCFSSSNAPGGLARFWDPPPQETIQRLSLHAEAMPNMSRSNAKLLFATPESAFFKHVDPKKIQIAQRAAAGPHHLRRTGGVSVL
jgi:hypothetical protein